MTNMQTIDVIVKNREELEKNVEKMKKNNYTALDASMVNNFV